jgi:Nucleolar protein 12 (25kDa)
MSEQSVENKNTMKRKNRGKEIVFDPEERRKYLQGFSERKQQRRSFGLAMQKVKDRLARLDDRREHRKSELERIQEAERQKRTLLEDALIGRATPINSDHNSETTTKDETATYQDMESTEKWGGQVIVSTRLASLSDESDEEDKMVPRKQNIDRRQRYAGDVSKFINQMKGSLPAKKKSTGGQPRKGNHGATNMSGIGGAANLKLAKKALSKVQAKVGKPATGKKRRKRSKK